MVEFSYIGTAITRLGESPLWDERRHRLWWVDVVTCRIAGCRIDGSDAVSWDYDQAVGSIGLAEDCGLVAAMADGFYAVDGDTGVATPIYLPDGIAPPVRFNDGKADRDGRFLSGTMTAHDLETRNGTLWQLGPDGTARLLERDFVIANAMCFSPDGEWLYFADSVEAMIRRYPYDRPSGAIGTREDFIDTRPYGSGPDGATVDADGHLWVALIQKQQIGCFDAAGELVMLIDVPLPYPSCVAFGGPALDVLFVTGISDSGWSLRAEGPTAGRILAISGLGATGIAETPYRHPRTDIMKASA